MENKIKVAIQGVQGAFHDIATREYFKDNVLEIVPCLTFEDLFALLDNGGCDYGMVAVENSVAGILSHNYFLLNEYSMQIVGEHYLRIVQNLMALPGSSIEDIKEVRSHPIALRQCHLFLNTLREKGVKMVESEDTALTAKLIAQDNLKGVAAVAGDLAAHIYGLDIIKAGIESNLRNFTRFLLLKRKSKAGSDSLSISDFLLNNDTLNTSYPICDPKGLVTNDSMVIIEQPNKASVSFTLGHKPGALCKVLEIFSSYNLNLTLIQSLPVPGKEWEYKFFADFVFSEAPSYEAALEEVAKVATSVTLSGLYCPGLASMQPSGEGHGHGQ